MKPFAEDPRLGRWPSPPDPRDARWSAVKRLDLPDDPAASCGKFHWANGAWIDQGSRPTCVGASLVHLLEDGPFTYAPKRPDARPLIVDPEVVYDIAQGLDEWPGTGYAGTSVRAGCDALLQLGLIGSYLWLRNIDEFLRALAVRPIELGTWWTSEMFKPDRSGLIRYRGDVEGGHAYVANGRSRDGRRIRCKQSWVNADGTRWARRGHFWLLTDDAARLIDEFGEAALLVEKVA